jgi:DNA-binding NtrC family response regulator
VDFRSGRSMEKRKTKFEVVRLEEIAPLLGGTLPDGLTSGRKPARILSVSYDRSLAITREMLFTRGGFEVSSAFDIHQALQCCSVEPFDLIVIGHSIPLPQRQSLLTELRSRSSTPILVLHCHGESPLAGANYTFDSAESPALLLETVTSILKPRITCRSNA